VASLPEEGKIVDEVFSTLPQAYTGVSGRLGIDSTLRG